MPNLRHDDAQLRSVLTNARAIAVVGHSDKSHRTSYQIAQFLKNAGYTVYPVNPTVTSINGQPCYPSLHEIPVAIDIVNVFRRSQYLPDIAKDAIAIGATTLWAQLGVHDAIAMKTALDSGLNVITDACIKLEYQRLGIPTLRR
jgi:predicted CoA-binding protein